MHHFVYKITNLINGKKYIGKHSTCNIKDGYLGSGIVLKRAIGKYGKENFKKEILFESGDEAQVYRMEKIYVTPEIVNNPMYYNIMVGGNGASSGKNNTFYGKHHTEETKTKIGESSKNRTILEKTKQKISNTLKGRIFSKETKKLMSKAKKGHIVSKETRKKLSISLSGKNHPMWGKTGEDCPNFGKEHTEESKKKMSIIAKNRPKIKCPYCGKEIDKGNYTLWHGEKCKFK